MAADETHAHVPDDAELIAPPEAYAICTGEAVLRRRTGDLSELAERLQTIVWQYDVSRDVFTYISPAIEDLIGMSRERLYTESGLWFNLAHPEDGDWARAFCATATMHRKDHDFEYRMVHADGRIVWVRDIVTVVLDDDGSVAGLEGMIVDMTEHKRLEAEVALRAHELEMVFELLGGVYYRVDRSGVITSTSVSAHTSDAAARTTGLPIDTVLPRPLADAAERGRRQVRAGATSWLEEVTYSNEGDQRLIEISVFPLPGGDSAVIERDITERLDAREAEERYRIQLKALAGELEITAERERRRLAEEIHDRVSQTLAIARMRIMDRQAQPDCPLEADGVRSLVEEAIREARTLTADLAPVGLYELGLPAALRALGETLEKQHGLRCDVEDRLPRDPAITDDVLAFSFRATRELLMNVVKHAEAESAEIRVGIDDDMLRVTVRDSGKGAYVNPQDWMPGAEGGFGLFSVLERAQALGGDLEVHSKPGSGTIAVLTVPVAGDA